MDPLGIQPHAWRAGSHIDTFIPANSNDGILVTVSKELNGSVYGVENGLAFLFLYVLLYDPVISRYTYLLTYVGVRLIRISIFLTRGKRPAGGNTTMVRMIIATILRNSKMFSSQMLSHTFQPHDCFPVMNTRRYRVQVMNLFSFFFFTSRNSVFGHFHKILNR